MSQFTFSIAESSSNSLKQLASRETLSLYKRLISEDSLSLLNCEKSILERFARLHGVSEFDGDLRRVRSECVQHLMQGHCYTGQYHVGCRAINFAVPDRMQFRSSLFEFLLVDVEDDETLKHVCVCFGMSDSEFNAVRNIEHYKEFISSCYTAFESYRDVYKLICDVDEMSMPSVLLGLRLHRLSANGNLEDMKFDLVNHLLQLIAKMLAQPLIT